MNFLITSIRFLSTDNQLRSIIISSSVPAEGKSLINILLSKTFSESGKKVLLIDADLRKPQLHYRIGINNLKGLSNIINDSKSSISEVIQTVPNYPNWDIITAGIRPPDPTRLLGSERFKQIKKELYQANEYDLIIWDTPPLLGLADASLIAEDTDGIILLISLAKVDRSLPKETILRAKNSGLNILGLLTNNIKDYSNPNNPYYYGTYGYGNYFPGKEYAEYANIEDDDKEVNTKSQSESDKNNINKYQSYLKTLGKRFLKWLDS